MDDLIDADDDVAVAAITAAELLVGVERADEARRLRRAEAVEDVLATLAVEPYDLGVARRTRCCSPMHGCMGAHAARTISSSPRPPAHVTAR